MIIGVKSLLECCPATSDSFDIDVFDVIMQQWRHKELCDEWSTSCTVTMVTALYNMYNNKNEIKW